MNDEVSPPLSDQEFDLLAARGLDLQWVLGAVHAIWIAPGLIAPAQWIPLAFAKAPADHETIGILLRLYDQVGKLLREGSVFVPEEQDEDLCVTFAAGYAAAAALDPIWLANDNHWTFAEPLAYLGGRHDLLSAAFRAVDDTDLERRRIILRDLDRIVITTYTSFAKHRARTAQTLADARAAATARAAPRIGPNELCPCGSRKKYKRCCLPL